MSYYARIIQGNHVKDVEMYSTSFFSIGEGNQYTYSLPKGSLDGSSVVFRWENGWRIECRGQVTRNGTELSESSVRSGDQFVMGSGTGVAVSIIEIEDNPQGALLIPEGKDIVIGRKMDSDIQLKDGRVSGRHARLYLNHSHCILTDLNSTNGTYHNGNRVTEVALQDGDFVSIGQVTLKYFDKIISVYGPKDAVVVKQSSKMHEATSNVNIPLVEYPYFSRSPRKIRGVNNLVIDIDPAPSIGEKPDVNWVTVFLPAASTVIGMLLITLLTGMNPAFFLLSGPMMIAGIIVSVLNYRKQQKKYESFRKLRSEKYLCYIAECESKIQNAIDEQRCALETNSPMVSECMQMVCSIDRRLWERKPDDPDFLSMAVGRGSIAACVQVNIPKTGFVMVEDEFTYLPKKIADKYRFVENVPICCDLKDVPTLGIVGDKHDCINLAWQMIIEATTLHGYDELKIVVIFPENERLQWQWTRWLPHSFDANRDNRFLACNEFEAKSILDPIYKEIRERSVNLGMTGAFGNTVEPSPRYLFIVAAPDLLAQQPIVDYLLSNDPDLGVETIVLASGLKYLPRRVQQIIEIQSLKGVMYNKSDSQHKQLFNRNSVLLKQCDQFAREMAPIRLPEKNVSQLLPSCISFLEGLKITKVEQLDIEDFWQNSCAYQSMAVPIGVKANGDLYYFDINEKADGPHGLIAGGTGSGKTRMIQAWILSMAIQFSPQEVAFVLIDFKGTGLILPFQKLPHLAGTISDLDDNITRNLIALQAELQRRKSLFDEIGVDKISDYQKRFRNGLVSEPMPYLIVIIDEYAEFKDRFPDFTAAINGLFRTGRALGVYIVLATQKPAGVVSAQSESNVRFRWCLRVNELADSKEVLGNAHDEAYSIRNVGRAYIRVGNDEKFDLIQSFYVDAPYQKEGKTFSKSNQIKVSVVDLQGRRTDILPAENRRKAVTSGTEIEALVNYISAYSKNSHIKSAKQIWNKKMPENVFLPDLLKSFSISKHEELAPIVGIYDDPHTQTQAILRLPLSAEGHAAIFGMPGTGKTIFLQTVVMALCSQYSPCDVNIYILDFGGWSMGMFRDFPHVGGIANDNEEDKVEKTIFLLEKEIEKRKLLFSEIGVGSIRAYRSQSGKSIPFITLVIDNFASVRSMYPQYDSFFQRIGREGGNYGIYMVASAANPSSLGYKLSQSIKTMWALQMKDSSDYLEIVGRTAGLLPECSPGRGLCKLERIVEFQTSLPASGDDTQRGLEIRRYARMASKEWKGQAAPAIPVLPQRIPFGTCHANEEFTLGLTTFTIQPYGFSFGADVTLLVSALKQYSTSNILSMLVKQVSTKQETVVATYGLPSGLSSKEIKIDTGEAFDQFMRSIRPELQKRHNERSMNSVAEFPPIYVFVNDWRRCYKEISDETAGRLRAFCQLGTGLNIHLIIADTAENIGALCHVNEPITFGATKGLAIICGGTSKNHQFLTELVPVNHQNDQIDEGAGWVCTPSGERELVLFMDPND